jgi:hypothetical protein
MPVHCVAHCAAVSITVAIIAIMKDLLPKKKNLLALFLKRGTLFVILEHKEQGKAVKAVKITT